MVHFSPVSFTCLSIFVLVWLECSLHLSQIVDSSQVDFSLCPRLAIPRYKYIKVLLLFVSPDASYKTSIGFVLLVSSSWNNNSCEQHLQLGIDYVVCPVSYFPKKIFMELNRRRNARNITQ